MDERLCPLILGQRFKQSDPAGVDGGDEIQRHLDRQSAVAKLGPAVFVIRFDRRRCVFGQSELKPNERIYMAVGDVVNRLADGPALGTIGRFELFVRHPLDGDRKPVRQLSDRIDAVSSGGG